MEGFELGGQLLLVKLKASEKVTVGPEIEIVVTKLFPNGVELGIKAPRELKISFKEDKNADSDYHKGIQQGDERRPRSRDRQRRE